MLPGPIARQRFELVAGRDAKIFEAGCVRNTADHNPRALGNVWRDTARALTASGRLGVLVVKTLDYRSTKWASAGIISLPTFYTR